MLELKPDRKLTVVEKRGLLEAIDKCVKYDVLTKADVLMIIAICDKAADREISRREAKT